MLDPGQLAPPFDLPDQDGRIVSSASLRGDWALLWWYPKAGTPGCTIEGQVLRDRSDDFASAGCRVVGLSFDSPEVNRAWAALQGFRFPLLCDVDHAVGRQYEVEREPDDQYVAFPLRVSYLLDPEGLIRKTFSVSGVADHATEVLRALAGLHRQ